MRASCFPAFAVPVEGTLPGYSRPPRRRRFHGPSVKCAQRLRSWQRAFPLAIDRRRVANCWSAVGEGVEVVVHCDQRRHRCYLFVHFGVSPCLFNSFSAFAGVSGTFETISMRQIARAPPSIAVILPPSAFHWMP